MTLEGTFSIARFSEKEKFLYWINSDFGDKNIPNLLLEGGEPTCLGINIDQIYSSLLNGSL